MKTIVKDGKKELSDQQIKKDSFVSSDNLQAPCLFFTQISQIVTVLLSATFTAACKHVWPSCTVLIFKWKIHIVQRLQLLLIRLDEKSSQNSCPPCDKSSVRIKIKKSFEVLGDGDSLWDGRWCSSHTHGEMRGSETELELRYSSYYLLESSSNFNARNTHHRSGMDFPAHSSILHHRLVTI